MEQEKLQSILNKRNPKFEKRYEESIFRKLSDYGRGTTQLQESRGKIYGAGYEIYIVAFFIGLYHDQRRPLVEDRDLTKTLGQPIQFWGNVDQKFQRKNYSELRDYLFVALVAKTDIDFLGIDKGTITAREAANMLIKTMEEYANWGLNYMNDKLEENPNYFYGESRLLDLFLSFNIEEESSQSNESALPESLD